MSEQLQFRTVLRGFDPEQVKSAMDELQSSVVTARRVSADRTIELTRMQEQLATTQRDLEAAKARLSDADSHPTPTGAPTVTDVGARIGSILALANEEAEELRAAGRDDARRRVEEADASVAAVRADAERYAEQLRVSAHGDADHIIDEARHRAAEVVDAATREAQARQAEAQAIVDDHRAQADAVAAFGGQLSKHTERLQQASARVEQLALEEVALVERQAQESVDRIQRDTENQLAAVDARRQSITAQLSTVGALLQDLGRSVGSSTGDATPPTQRLAPPDNGQTAQQLGRHEANGSHDGGSPAAESDETNHEEAGARR